MLALSPIYLPIHPTIPVAIHLMFKLHFKLTWRHRYISSVNTLAGRRLGRVQYLFTILEFEGCTDSETQTLSEFSLGCEQCTPLSNTHPYRDKEDCSHPKVLSCPFLVRTHPHLQKQPPFCFWSKKSLAFSVLALHPRGLSSGSLWFGYDWWCPQGSCVGGFILCGATLGSRIFKRWGLVGGPYIN
jgi:hypothetical protein